MSAAPPPPSLESDSGSLAAADGVRIAYRSWRQGPDHAGVLVSHGLGEHGGRYAGVARHLVPRGFSVCAPDHRGHGLSGGQRAYLGRFEEVVDDLERLRAKLEDGLFARRPVFLYGHSFGGLVALRHLQTHPGRFRGAILSAPLLGIAVKAPKWKLALSGVLSKLLPRLPLGNEIDPAALSHDPAYVRAYRDDPLVHDRITPRLYTEMVEHIGRAFAERGRLGLPLLFLVPTDDAIVDEDAVLRFAGGLPGDVTVRVYEGFRHEPHNEVGRERVMADVAEWLEARAGA